MKKLLAILLVAATIFALVACGTKDDNKVSITYLYNTGAAHQAIAEYVQAAFAAAGVKMTLENQEWNTFLNTRKDGNYTVARNGWVADYNDPICFLDMWTTASGNNDVQFGRGAHATLAVYDLDLTSYGYDIKVENGTWAETYDVLISTIKTCPNTTTRYALMHLAEDILMSTGCITPIYYYTDAYMIDDSVNGFFSNPLGYKYFMYTTVEGDTSSSINVCLASEPDTLDPALNSAVDGATLCVHLFSGLAKWTQAADGSFEIQPDAATALPAGVVGADGKVTYTYTIREDAKWSNGDDLTAQDFVDSWNRAASASLGADYGYMFEVIDGYDKVSALTEKLDENGNVVVDKDGETVYVPEFPDAKLNLTVVDAKTFTVTLASDVSYWNELLAFPAYFPVHPSKHNSDDWATDPSTYIGNGPYTMAAWTHNSVITLQKNENYYGAENVTMNTIKFYLSDDPNNMLANFKTGEWKLIDDVPTNEIPALKRDYPNEFVIAGQIGTYYICWNINASLLPKNTTLTGVDAYNANVEIRQALGLLLDRNHIVNAISQSGEVPASSFVAMGMTNPDGTQFYKTANSTTDSFDGYYDVSEEAFESNFQKALEILSVYFGTEESK